MTWRLLPVVGKRALFGFGAVTFLVAALLSAVHITSRYALNLYVEDQLRRTPWDLVVYDQAGSSNPAVAGGLRSLENIERVEQLAFLRAAFSSDVTTLVDGRPLATPWLSVLSASDPSLLPPELRNAVAQGSTDEAILALVGPESAVGEAFVSLQPFRPSSSANPPTLMHKHSVLQSQNRCFQPLNKRFVMRGDEDCRRKTPVQFQNEPDQSLAHFRVDVTGWLIGKQDID